MHTRGRPMINDYPISSVETEMRILPQEFAMDYKQLRIRTPSSIPLNPSNVAPNL